MSNSKIIVGIISAAVVGALIGVLLAPEDGPKTRKKIKKKTNSLASDLIAALEKGKSDVETAAENLKEEGASYKNQAANKAAEYVDDAKKEINKF